MSENKYLLDCIYRFRNVIKDSSLLKGHATLQALNSPNYLNIEGIIATFEILVNKLLVKKN